MRLLGALIRKDCICLLRSKDWLAAVFLFALILVVLSSLAFRQIGYGQAELREVTPGIIWIIFFFCGVLSLNYAFSFEREGGALEALLLSPAEPALIYFSKVAANFLLLFVVQSFVLVALGTLFGVELFSEFGDLLALSVLVALGFTALGTLFGSIAASVPGRDILLPLILFPLCLPLLAAAVFVTQEILAGGGLNTQSFWFLLVLGFDVISLALSTVLFEMTAGRF